MSDSQTRAQEAQWCTSNDPTERFFAAQNAAINAAPPQAETGGERGCKHGHVAHTCTACEETRRRDRLVADRDANAAGMHRLNSELGVAKMQRGEALADRDALRVQLEAALAREAPEHAWRKAWTLAIGCAVRRLELGGYNKIIRSLISDIAPLPYEPPGAKS